MANLKDIVKAAAKAAFDAGVDAGNQEQLVAWIRVNCRYRVDTEYFLVLLIGCELADLRAQAMGYEHEVARAYAAAKAESRTVGHSPTPRNEGGLISLEG